MGDAHLLVQKESMIKTFLGGEGGSSEVSFLQGLDFCDSSFTGIR